MHQVCNFSVSEHRPHHIWTVENVERTASGYQHNHEAQKDYTQTTSNHTLGAHFPCYHRSQLHLQVNVGTGLCSCNPVMPQLRRLTESGPPWGLELDATIDIHFT